MEASTDSWAREHWLLAGMESRTLDGLIAAGREARFAPGEVLFHEGDIPDGLYMLAGGAVRISAVGDSGETLLSVAKAGDLVGELGVLDAEPRSATAVAIGMVSTFFLPAEPFLDGLELSPLICMKMLAHLTRRLREANGRLGELTPVATVSWDSEHGDRWP